MVKWFKLFICCLPVLFSTAGYAQRGGFNFNSLFTAHKQAFDSIIKHKDAYRLQIIYTRIDRDKKGHAHLHTYKYDADKYYYYCASMVKLPACVLALEKLNKLSKYQLNMLDSLGIDSLACGSLNPANMMLGTSHSCLAQYIKEMLMVSNNNAFNPVYDFLGQHYFQDRLHKLGYRSAVISHRFAACDSDQNRFCNPVSFYDRYTHELKYRQPCTLNKRSQHYKGCRSPLVGKGYIDATGKLAEQPKNFRNYNYIKLSDLHKLLTAIIFPQTAKHKPALTDADYNYLHKCMGMFPRESSYPVFDTLHYPDQYMNYFIGTDTGASTMPAGVRVFNKVGMAYGFMTDCSYIADTINGVEFFLSCSMYLNADSILNDGIYEYDKAGFPFFNQLYKSIYAEELVRHKKNKPVFRLPDFADPPAETIPAPQK